MEKTTPTSNYTGPYDIPENRPQRRNALNPQIADRAFKEMKDSSRTHANSSSSALIPYRGPQENAHRRQRAIELSKQKNLSESEVNELVSLLQALSIENKVLKDLYARHVRPSSQLPTHRTVDLPDRYEDQILRSRKHPRLENGHVTHTTLERPRAPTNMPPHPQVEELDDPIPPRTNPDTKTAQKKEIRTPKGIEPYQTVGHFFPPWGESH